MIYLAADHRGFQLKEELKKFLIEKGYAVEDLGAEALELDDDYVDFARRACEKISENPEIHRGILICGSGHGMDMVANKYKGLRAALVFNKTVAVQSREHENANILILASDWFKFTDAKEIAQTWLGARFTAEARNVRRLGKIKEIEEKNFR